MTAQRLMVVATTVLVAAAATVTPARAEGPFSPFSGSWSGSGRIQLDSGATEPIRCRAYYTPKDGGEGLGMAIRCASASYKIELRSQLQSSGGQVSGSWEERTFNAAGQVTGRVSATNINLSVIGGGLTASMSVATHGSNQSVGISTTGSGLKRVEINLSRS
jgi:hypothetical protein